MRELSLTGPLSPSVGIFVCITWRSPLILPGTCSICARGSDGLRVVVTSCSQFHFMCILLISQLEVCSRPVCFFVPVLCIMFCPCTSCYKGRVLPFPCFLSSLPAARNIATQCCACSYIFIVCHLCAACWLCQNSFSCNHFLCYQKTMVE